jgi:hypothetical protein
MKTILIFLTAVTLSFAQNPELFSNEWHLEKMVIDNVDFPTPTQFEHRINFDTPIEESPNTLSFISLIYCGGYYTFMGLINNETIQNEGGFFFDPNTDNCDFSDNELNYMGNVHMFFEGHSPPIISYIINDIDNHKQLVLTNLDNYKLYYNNTTLSQEVFLFENTVSLYPNPVEKILNIQNTASNLSKVQIYDLNGRLLHNHTLQTNEVSLDVSQLNSGVYLVVLENEMGNQITRKIVKTGK